MESDLRILLNFCAAFGIYTKKSQRKWPKILNRFAHAYPLVLIIILALQTACALLTIRFPSDFAVTGFVAALVFLSQMITQFCALLEGIVKREHHEEFLRLLNEIEITLKLKLKCNIRQTGHIDKLHKKLSLLIFILLFGIVIFAVNFALITKPGYYWWAQIAVITMRLRFFQLLFYIENLKIFMFALNGKLKQVVSLKCETSKQLLDIDYRSLKSIETLKTLRDLYSCIHKAFQNLNDFAQLSLLAGTASYFVDFTCHLYWALLALSNILPIQSLVLAATTIIPLGLNIFVFCHNCQVVKEQVSSCVVILNLIAF